MARYTAAYSSFIVRLGEVSALQYLAKKHTSLVNFDPEKSNALCRAGVVLLCSHIEGFLDELVGIALEKIVTHSMAKSKLSPSFFYFLSRDLIMEINQATDPSKITLKIQELLERDKNIWSNQTHFLEPVSKERFMSNFSTPDFEKICALLKRFGYEQYRGDLAARLQSQNPIVINMLNQVIDQRNKIAHGDHITTSTHTDLDSMIQLTKQFCRNTDQVVATWFSKNGCPIR